MLLMAGYWPTTYWPESYWNNLYWPGFTVAVGKKWWDRNACVINIIMAEEEEWH